MSNWLPVIATLLGAVVGGTISILVSTLSARAQARLSAARFKEDRAVWAANRQLDQLQSLHASAEVLGDATQQFRIRTAWDRTRSETGEDVPAWVMPYAEARRGFETALREVHLSASMVDDDLINEYAKLSKGYWEGYLLGNDPVGGLQALEFEVEKFRKFVADRYRSIVSNRKAGADVYEAPEIEAPK